MAGERARGGKKGRKYGRWRRSPAMKRYVAEGRDMANAKKRAKRHERRVVRDATKKRQVARGYARALRRGNPAPSFT